MNDLPPDKPELNYTNTISTENNNQPLDNNLTQSAFYPDHQLLPSSNPPISSHLSSTAPYQNQYLDHFIPEHGAMLLDLDYHAHDNDPSAATSSSSTSTSSSIYYSSHLASSTPSSTSSPLSKPSTITHFPFPLAGSSQSTSYQNLSSSAFPRNCFSDSSLFVMNKRGIGTSNSLTKVLGKGKNKKNPFSKPPNSKNDDTFSSSPLQQPSSPAQKTVALTSSNNDSYQGLVPSRPGVEPLLEEKFFAHVEATSHNPKGSSLIPTTTTTTTPKITTTINNNNPAANQPTTSSNNTNNIPSSISNIRHGSSSEILGKSQDAKSIDSSLQDSDQSTRVISNHLNNINTNPPSSSSTASLLHDYTSSSSSSPLSDLTFLPFPLVQTTQPSASPTGSAQAVQRNADTSLSDDNNSTSTDNSAPSPFFPSLENTWVLDTFIPGMNNNSTNGADSDPIAPQNILQHNSSTPTIHPTNPDAIPSSSSSTTTPPHPNPSLLSINPFLEFLSTASPPPTGSSSSSSSSSLPPSATAPTFNVSWKRPRSNAPPSSYAANIQQFLNQLNESPDSFESDLSPEDTTKLQRHSTSSSSYHSDASTSSFAVPMASSSSASPLASVMTYPLQGPESSPQRRSSSTLANMVHQSIMGQNFTGIQNISPASTGDLVSPPAAHNSPMASTPSISPNLTPHQGLIVSASSTTPSSSSSVSSTGPGALIPPTPSETGTPEDARVSMLRSSFQTKNEATKNSPQSSSSPITTVPSPSSSLLTASSATSPQIRNEVSVSAPTSANGPMAGQTANAQKIFKCPQCPLSFRRNHDLKRHVKIHLPVRPYTCSLCEKAFNRKDALRRHLLSNACRKRPNRRPATAAAVAAAVASSSSSPSATITGSLSDGGSSATLTSTSLERQGLQETVASAATATIPATTIHSSANVNFSPSPTNVQMAPSPLTSAQTSGFPQSILGTTDFDLTPILTRTGTSGDGVFKDGYTFRSLHNNTPGNDKSSADGNSKSSKGGIDQNLWNSLMNHLATGLLEYRQNSNNPQLSPSFSPAGLKFLSRGNPSEGSSDALKTQRSLSLPISVETSASSKNHSQSLPEMLEGHAATSSTPIKTEHSTEQDNNPLPNQVRKTHTTTTQASIVSEYMNSLTRAQLDSKSAESVTPPLGSVTSGHEVLGRNSPALDGVNALAMLESQDHTDIAGILDEFIDPSLSQILGLELAQGHTPATQYNQAGHNYHLENALSQANQNMPTSANIDPAIQNLTQQIDHQMQGTGNDDEKAEEPGSGGPGGEAAVADELQFGRIEAEMMRLFQESTNMYGSSAPLTSGQSQPSSSPAVIAATGSLDMADKDIQGDFFMKDA